MRTGAEPRAAGRWQQMAAGASRCAWAERSRIAPKPAVPGGGEEAHAPQNQSGEHDPHDRHRAAEGRRCWGLWDCLQHWEVAKRSQRSSSASWHTAGMLTTPCSPFGAPKAGHNLQQTQPKSGDEGLFQTLQ